MGLLDKFRRRDGGTDFRQPENAIAPDEDGGTSMYEKIDNPELEGGVPDVQPAGGSSKSPQQIALFGTAILGAGIAIAGLMVWANRPTSPDEGIKKEQLEISGNRGYDFAADQARLKAEMENTAASEADMPEAASDASTHACAFHRDERKRRHPRVPEAGPALGRCTHLSAWWSVCVPDGRWSVGYRRGAH